MKIKKYRSNEVFETSLIKYRLSGTDSSAKQIMYEGDFMINQEKVYGLKPLSIEWWIEQYKMCIDSKWRAYNLVQQGGERFIEHYARYEELSKWIRQRLVNKIDNEIEKSLEQHH